MNNSNFMGVIYPPKPPKFMFVPDDEKMELYILCTNPYAFIWVQQTTPARLFIIDGKQDENILVEALNFYQNKTEQKLDKN